MGKKRSREKKVPAPPFPLWGHFSRNGTTQRPVLLDCLTRQFLPPKSGRADFSPAVSTNPAGLFCKHNAAEQSGAGRVQKLGWRVGFLQPGAPISPASSPSRLARGFFIPRRSNRTVSSRDAIAKARLLFSEGRIPFDSYEVWDQTRFVFRRPNNPYVETPVPISRSAAPAPIDG
jgi:hypothetical protein